MMHAKRLILLIANLFLSLGLIGVVYAECQIGELPDDTTNELCTNREGITYREQCSELGGKWSCPHTCKEVYSQYKTLISSPYGECCGPSDWETTFDNDFEKETSEYKIGRVVAEKRFLYNKQCQMGTGFNWNGFKINANIKNKLSEKTIFKVSVVNSITGIIDSKEVDFSSGEEKEISFEYEGDNGRIFNGHSNYVDVGLLSEEKDWWLWECKDSKKLLIYKHYLYTTFETTRASINKNSYEYSDVCFDFKTRSEINMNVIGVEKGGVYWFYTPEPAGVFEPEGKEIIKHFGVYYLYYCGNDWCTPSGEYGNGCQSDEECEIMHSYYPNYGKKCDKEHVPYMCVHEKKTTDTTDERIVITEAVAIDFNVYLTINGEPVFLVDQDSEITREGLKVKAMDYEGGSAELFLSYEGSQYQGIFEEGGAYTKTISLSGRDFEITIEKIEPGQVAQTTVAEETETTFEVPTKAASKAKHVSPEEESECNGCLEGKDCLPFGTRESINNASKFCNIGKKWLDQKGDQESCQNNYECTSNFCSNKKCYDITQEVKETKTIVEKIMSWIRKLFGLNNFLS